MPGRSWLHACLLLAALQCVWLLCEALETWSRADRLSSPLLFSDPPFARVIWTGPEQDLGRTPVCLRVPAGARLNLSRPGYTAIFQVPPQGPRHGDVAELAPVIPVLSPLLLRYPMFTLAAFTLCLHLRRRRRARLEGETPAHAAVDMRQTGRRGLSMDDAAPAEAATDPVTDVTDALLAEHGERQRAGEEEGGSNSC